MKKMLCICPSMDTGGAETFLMKILRNIDRNMYHLDFCVSTDKEGFYDKEITSYGSKIYRIHKKTDSYKRFKKDLQRILKENKYDAVFRSGATGFMAIDLWVAKKCGVPIRAFRSSNAGTTENGLRQFINKITRRFLTSSCNVKIAPSLLAAQYTFGKKLAKKEVCVLNNGIDVNFFQFDKFKAESLKNSLGLKGCRVFGHIGRFAEQKNHKFLIQSFSEYCKRYDDAKLVLVGDGPLKNTIISMIASYNLEDKVVLLDVRSDINELLMTFDVLLLPSHFEGMPNVVIEAQCTGLPCLISDKVTKEARVTDLVSFLPINNKDDTDRWVQKMHSSSVPSNRIDYANKMKDKGYDINDVADKFIQIIFGKE